MKPDLKDALERIQNQASAAARAIATAESILKTVESQIIGLRIDSHRSGNLKGLYQITDVDLSYDGKIQAHGRKVTSSGKLGAQRWELGRIYPGRLGL